MKFLILNLTFVWSTLAVIRSTLLFRYLGKLSVRIVTVYRAEMERMTFSELEALDVSKRFRLLPGATLLQWAEISLSFWRTFESYAPRELLDDLAQSEEHADVLSASEVG